MKIKEMEYVLFRQTLASEGLFLHIGPFIVKLQSSFALVAESVYRLYADFIVEVKADFADFHVSVQSPEGIRRWFRPQCVFSFDGLLPFKPLPANHAFVFFEWGLNWCIAQYAHQYLIIHSAVLEKNGKAVILPGVPGAGKSTLCAALSLNGWRLLSDEFALFSLSEKHLTPIPRPVSLKNESVDIIRNLKGETVFGPLVENTHKGTIALMKPITDYVEASQQTVKPAWVILPEFKPGSTTELTTLMKGKGFMEVKKNCFNYDVLGHRGFKSLGELIKQCDCYNFSYSNLDEALRTFDELAFEQ